MTRSVAHPTQPPAARVRPRPPTLQQTASVLFALIAVVPLLFLTWVLHRYNVLSRLQAQIGLGVALLLSLLGFRVLRNLTGRISELTHAVGRATTVGTRPARVPAPMPPQLPLPAAAEPTATATAAVPSPPASTVAPASDEPRVPGLGAIREIHDLHQAVAALWRREALALKGQRVLVSVLNARDPIAGTLVDAVDDGLLIDLGVKSIGISYKRLTAIDPEPSSEGGSGST